MKINASQGRLRGRVLAISGMVLGGVGFFILPVVAAMVLPAYAKVVERARIVKQEEDIRILHTACKNYAVDHDGRFPPDLQEVYPDYLGEESRLKTIGPQTRQLKSCTTSARFRRYGCIRNKTPDRLARTDR